MPAKGSSSRLSTLADQVGACAHALLPLHDLIAAHVLAAERLHGDDTTVPVLAKGKTETGRLWIYVRDDRPFGGTDPPAALFHYSRDRRGEHPQAHLAAWTGILQADAYGGYDGSMRRTRARARDRGGLLGPCPAQVLRARRHRKNAAARKSRGSAARSRRSRWRR